MQNQRDLELLLLGKTGMGKSATGNAFLGRRAFTSQGSTTSVTVSSQKDVVQLDSGRNVFVVDTPGVGDTNCTQAQRNGMFLTSVREAVAMSPGGYHACLLVFRYGNRVTDEDKEVVKYLKKVFGENFVRNYCILLLTHGDNYDTDPDIRNTPFQTWCLQQTGIFASLFEEVGRKAILFNNRGDHDVLETQRNKLIDLVDRHMLEAGKYTDDTFRQAQVFFHKYMIQNGVDAGFHDVLYATSKILAKFERIHSMLDGQRQDVWIAGLERLEGEISRAINATERMKSTWFVKRMKPFMRRTQRCLEQTILDLRGTAIVGQREDATQLQIEFRELRDHIHRSRAEFILQNISISLEKAKDNIQQCKIQ